MFNLLRPAAPTARTGRAPPATAALPGPNSCHSFPTRPGSPGGRRSRRSRHRSRGAGSPAWPRPAPRLAPPPRPPGGRSRNARRHASRGCTPRRREPGRPPPRGQSRPPPPVLPTCGPAGHRAFRASSWRPGVSDAAGSRDRSPTSPRQGWRLSPAPPGRAIFKSVTEAGGRECHV